MQAGAHPRDGLILHVTHADKVLNPLQGALAKSKHVGGAGDEVEGLRFTHDSNPLFWPALLWRNIATYFFTAFQPHHLVAKNPASFSAETSTVYQS